jgi:hypothetical protein
MKAWKYKNYEVRRTGIQEWWKTNALNVEDAAKAYAYHYDRAVHNDVKLRDGFSAKIEVRLEGSDQIEVVSVSGTLEPRYSVR